MNVGSRARTGLLVVAAVLVGLVGPCICEPTVAMTRASHACCDSEAGLKPAPLECCAGCSVSLRALDSDLTRASSPGVALASASRAEELVLRQSAAPLFPPLQPIVVPTPPTILRV